MSSVCHRIPSAPPCSHYILMSPSCPHAPSAPPYLQCAHAPMSPVHPHIRNVSPCPHAPHVPRTSPCPQCVTMSPVSPHVPNTSPCPHSIPMSPICPPKSPMCPMPPLQPPVPLTSPCPIVPYIPAHGSTATTHPGGQRGAVWPWEGRTEPHTDLHSLVIFTAVLEPEELRSAERGPGEQGREAKALARLAVMFAG